MLLAAQWCENRLAFDADHKLKQHICEKREKRLIKINITYLGISNVYTNCNDGYFFSFENIFDIYLSIYLLTSLKQ